MALDEDIPGNPEDKTIPSYRQINKVSSGGYDLKYDLKKGTLGETNELNNSALVNMHYPGPLCLIQSSER